MAGLRPALGPTTPAGLGLAETGLGIALLRCGAPRLKSLAGETADRRVVIVTRILGTRQLLQGLITLRRPTRRVLQLGATADALHAGTMIAAAAAGVGPRRLTIASATIALVFTVAGTALSRTPAAT